MISVTNSPIPTMKSLANRDSIALIKIFVIFDDLSMIIFSTKSVGRPSTLSLSEIATISWIKAKYGITSLKELYRLLKDRYYLDFHLPSYKSFVLSMNNYAPYLLILINIILAFDRKRQGVIKIIDSTSIPVCHNIRISTHKVMRQLASRSKSSLGWFYGLKLHLAVDLQNHFLKLKFTTGSTDDRKILSEFLEEIKSSIILADAGYVSQSLENKAAQRGNILLISPRKNNKKIMTPFEQMLLNLRHRIETNFSVLKERYHLITSLPRSVKGYLSHYIRTIFAYMFSRLLIS